MTRFLLSIFLVMGMTANGWCATELTAQRTYNQDVFDLGNGQKNYKIHVAQINYKDTDGSFKKIDTTLSQNMATDKWEQSKASYKCKLPRYADGEFEFYNGYEGANHTMKAIPQAQHVEGEYFKNDEGSYVLYKDAFGKGIDLKVYAYWAGLKKVIIINEKPADTKTALTFDFELILPTREETKDAVTKTVSAPVVDAKTATVWSKTEAEALDFTSKTLKIGFDDKCSYFRDAKVWDSGELNQSVDISLFIQNGKAYIRKTITPEILEKAVYPLMTDHPTSYYAGAGDGMITKGSSSWDGVHDSSTGTAAYTGTSGYAGRSYKGSSTSAMEIRRGFFPVDSSGIDDAATITSAILNLYVVSKANNDNDGDDWLNVVGETSQADPTSLTSEDFDQCGSINNPTEGATRIDIGSIATSQYNQWNLDATGISWIKKTAGDPYTMLGTRKGHDCIDSPYAGGLYTANEVVVSFSEDTSGTKDPYLDVTTEAGAPATAQLYIQNYNQGFNLGFNAGMKE